MKTTCEARGYLERQPYHVQFGCRNDHRCGQMFVNAAVMIENYSHILHVHIFYNGQACQDVRFIECVGLLIFLIKTGVYVAT